MNKKNVTIGATSDQWNPDFGPDHRVCDCCKCVLSVSNFDLSYLLRVMAFQSFIVRLVILKARRLDSTKTLSGWSPNEISLQCVASFFTMSLRWRQVE
jgi:hypothetical protein